VPDAVASVQGAGPLTARATFAATGLDRLELSTHRTDGSVITLTFIPAR